MKRISKDKSDKVPNTRRNLRNNPIETNEETDGKLSQFKKEAKEKIKSEKKLKREHITITSNIEESEKNIVTVQDEENLEKPQTSKKIKLFSETKPENWNAVLENLREMRKGFDAPVDTMGCDQCMDETAEPKV